MNENARRLLESRERWFDVRAIDGDVYLRIDGHYTNPRDAERVGRHLAKDLGVEFKESPDVP